MVAEELGQPEVSVGLLLVGGPVLLGDAVGRQPVQQLVELGPAALLCPLGHVGDDHHVRKVDTELGQKGSHAEKMIKREEGFEFFYAFSHSL